jgi:hypothetical protein
MKSCKGILVKNLPKWKKFQAELHKSEKKERKSVKFGFLDRDRIDGDIVRANARYRMAKSFGRISLDGFSQKTIDGYNALLKAALVYSAFETYVNTLDRKDGEGFYKRGYRLLDPEKRKKISKKILELDKDRKFYGFVFQYTDPEQGKQARKHIEKFYDGVEHNQVYLLALLRHLFFHGILTPKPTRVVKICDLLSDFFLEQVENDFRKRVQKTLNTKGIRI